jgi:type I restriction enzyme S subunit
MMVQKMLLSDLVIQMKNGTTAEQNQEGRGFPVSRIETISDGTIDPKRVRYVELEQDDVERWKVQRGDLLFSHINSVEHIGKSAIYNGAPEILIHGMNLLLLRPDRRVVLPEYLHFGLRSTKVRDHIRARCKRAVNQASINQKELGAIELPVPPLTEQHRILDLLSRAEGIVRLRRAAEKKAAELIPALFLDMFGDPATNPKGWPVVSLSDVCGKCTTRDPKKQPGEEFTYIDIAAIDNEHGQVSETKTMLGADAPSRARQIVRGGDVIVSTVRPNLRGSAQIPPHLDGQVCSTGFCVLRPSSKTTTGFIYAVIRSDWFVSELMKHVRGAQYPAVSDKDVFGVQIPFPPLSAQQEFSSRLDAVRSIQSQQSMALAKAQATFDALLARAFSN